MSSSNNSKDVGIETLKTATNYCGENRFDKMCAEVELETATYSSEIKNYLLLLKAIRNENKEGERKGRV